MFNQEDCDCDCRLSDAHYAVANNCYNKIEREEASKNA